MTKRRWVALLLIVLLLGGLALFPGEPCHRYSLGPLLVWGGGQSQNSALCRREP
jgi:hypothetical protein